jgi:uncharacterized protein
MTHFTPLSAALGGMIIGFSALLMWLIEGRIVGIAGIFGASIAARQTHRLWRLAFLAGLILGPLLYSIVKPLPALTVSHSVPLLIVGGLLVGFGTRLGNGCTSGHGICGIARFSKRSIVATAIFMATAAATVFAARHIFGA